jgi:hypothetical protein
MARCGRSVAHNLAYLEPLKAGLQGALGSAILLHDALEKLHHRRLSQPQRTRDADDRRARRAFRAVVEPTANLVTVGIADLFHRCVPTLLSEAAHLRYPYLSDLGGEHRAKPVPPKSDNCRVIGRWRIVGADISDRGEIAFDGAWRPLGAIGRNSR